MSVVPDGLLPPPGFRQRGHAPRGTRLVLIRHGECVANVEGRAGGPLGDGGLTERGRAQAAALAARLARTRELDGASALYTSTLPRAIETGAMIVPAIAPVLEPRPRAELEELRVGEADGLTWTEVAERFAPVDWDHDPTVLNVPGGESLVGFFERCRAALGELVAAHPGELVVVVTHGGVIEQAMKIYQGLEAGVRLAPLIEHCSMTEIEFDAGRTRLLRYNDRSPLEPA